MKKTLQTKVDVLKEKELIDYRPVCIALGVVGFAFLTAVGAYVRIPLPFTPVPITLQVFFVLLAGVVLGPYYGTASQALYIGLGALGLPMFTVVGAGFAHLAGPTGGYIVGFAASQAVIGLISRNRQSSEASIIRTCAAMLAGIAVIYIFGAAHLKIVAGLTWHQAVMMGALPFIPGDLVKGAAVALIHFKTAGRTREIFHRNS